MINKSKLNIQQKALQLQNLAKQLSHFQAQLSDLQMCLEPLYTLSQQIIKIINTNGKIFLCGNGGSAGDAQHLAAEFTGRFKRERKALPAIALTVDSSALTAIGNDYGFEHIFSRQLEALGHKGDVLLAFSTSGNSANVIEAIKIAKQLEMHTVLFCGRHAGKLGQSPHVDTNLAVPATQTDHIQQMHMILGHMLCDLVEEAYTEDKT